LIFSRKSEKCPKRAHDKTPFARNRAKEELIGASGFEPKEPKKSWQKTVAYIDKIGDFLALWPRSLFQKRPAKNPKYPEK
jgi:hypothetical protein